ncbi:MAG: histidinol dehydrogenase [Candidatus Methanomethylophilaceae archaeon]|nr:histidinol dehydrogenase [Candidatus Methanomethylophilaceae archaeon]MBQ7405484.1 histidinol dehydrogenase [Candidatus Methanomethylophilaceae archaeon]
MWKQVNEDFWKENRESKVDQVNEIVSDIIEMVREKGDQALIELAKKFDKVDLERVAVTREEIEEAYEKVSPELVEELENAAYNIQRFHEMQKPAGMWLTEVEPGVTLGVKSTPLERVGCYIPGGRASYPSTILMTVIPARVAGVDEVICCTPAPPNPLTLVAADIAGADEIYLTGGAQAIAAMALGTESIEPVQKIVGPGNVFVTSAKMMLRNRVEIDFPAGPSEIGVLADSTAVPEFLASDLIAQAEHDPSSACLLVTTDPDLPDVVWEHMERMIEKAPRKEIIEKALVNSGYIIATDMDLAIEIMNGIAPEHLSLQVSDPLDVLSKVRNGGSIFVGPYTPVAAGDYASGTNHVLPTAGHAATCSGLNVAHFMKTSTVQYLTKEGLASIGHTIQSLATAEGLHAHCESVRVRGTDDEEQ